MKKLLVVLLIAAGAAVSWFYLRPEPAVSVVTPVRDDTTLRRTSAGDVVGFIDQHGARAWVGIPYAAPPTGSRRWRAAQPPEPWSGVREALTAGGRCPQKPSLLAAGDGADATVAGSEDCLYLNVWAPPNGSGLPVMFWIHGGGNTIGSGDTYIGAALAAKENVVVITINYRLGPLGWFAHPALASGDPVNDSGNYGTLDVIRALEWTRDNAVAFGGDPGNVTVFGESAGAFDTLAMMASPLAGGLFHRAISQSGGFSPTPMIRASAFEADGGHPYSAREIVNRLLVADGRVSDREAASGVQGDMSNAELREYLYSKTPAEIFALWDSGGFGMINVPDNFGDGHVLPALTTREIFSNPANHNVVPVILGTNRDEPALFMAQDPQYVENFLWVFPRLKDEADYLRRVRYGAMAWKARGVDELADHMTEAGNGNVFAYRFDWDEEGSVAGYDLSKALGAAHFLEVPFVFGDFENFPLAYLFGSSPGKDALSRSMMSYWAAFAYAGDPGRGRSDAEPRWLRWGEDGRTSIILDTPDDGGIRMMERKVTRASVVEAIATDPEIPDQRTRCALYVNTFRWNGEIDRAEYERLGPAGCAEFDPEALVST
ncbi:MAG: carboxylesterase family protein [Pseudomonadales bacterium]